MKRTLTTKPPELPEDLILKILTCALKRSAPIAKALPATKIDCVHDEGFSPKTTQCFHYDFNHALGVQSYEHDAIRKDMIASVESGWFSPHRHTECEDYRSDAMKQRLECLKANGVEKICFSEYWPEYPLPVLAPTEIFVWETVDTWGPWPEDTSRLQVVSLNTSEDLTEEQIDRLSYLPKLTTLRLGNPEPQLQYLRRRLPQVQQIEYSCARSWKNCGFAACVQDKSTAERKARLERAHESTEH